MEDCMKTKRINAATVLKFREARDVWIVFYLKGGKKRDMLCCLDYDPEVRIGHTEALVAHAVADGYDGVKVQRWGLQRSDVRFDAWGALDLVPDGIVHTKRNLKTRRNG
jgi:hypothetical protein